MQHCLYVYIVQGYLNSRQEVASDSSRRIASLIRAISRHNIENSSMRSSILEAPSRKRQDFK